MNKLLVGLMLLTSCWLRAQDSHVLYGERNLTRDTMCMYFDCKGYVYPSARISNDELRDSGGSLKAWYLKHEHSFLEIAAMYHCDFNGVNDLNCLILNDSVTAFLIRNLNESAYSTVSFFIHGFRKPFVRVNGDTDSPGDYLRMTEAYRKFGNPDAKIVEVYWDALYGCCFSANSKSNKPLFQLFEQAQKNAQATGNSLKGILSGISKDTINIISHSLGAKVAVHSVLSINNIDLTPSAARVNICLIAPAISADLICHNYLVRNSEWDMKKGDNYRLYIAYNESDFVLRKKDYAIGIFGPGPYKYGNTSLGCNHRHAAERLAGYFKANFSTSFIGLYHLSNVGKCHHVSCYVYGENVKDLFERMSE